MIVLFSSALARGCALPHLVRTRVARCLGALLLSCALAATALAKAVTFDIPAQPLADALLAFSQQAAVEVLFSYDDVHAARSNALRGSYEPEAALDLLLHDTGFAARRRSRGQFVIAATTVGTGSVRGRLLGPDGAPLAGAEVSLPDARLATTTGADGRFLIRDVPAGTHQLTAHSSGVRPLQMTGLLVAAGRTLTVETQTLGASDEITQLEPFVVTDRAERLGAVARGASLLVPRIAGGNLDLPRNENGALPYRIYNRELIERSGVVNLNTFLQRELLDSDAATRPPEQDGLQAAFTTGSANVNLRGFGTDATIVLLNGRRLSESPPAPGSSALAAPDLNFIPLSLVQQIEVLPVSASALYSGNAVGGVVNVVLRPDLDTTEISTTYTNALGGCSAPQSILSLQHGRTLLGGKLRLRFNANFASSAPPTKADLGYDRPGATANVAATAPLHGATPNIRSSEGAPLFGDGTAAVTSVAPGADGTGGLAAFNGRAGLRNADLFAPAGGGLVASPLSSSYPFGRQEKRAAYLASATYDVLPALQLGFDFIHSGTIVNRGYDLFSADLALAAESPLNPFGQDVSVSLLESAPALGESYSEARVDFDALVLAALVRLPGEWRVTLDSQYTRSRTRFRGVVGADPERWQALVERGFYNPLRDTQALAPPAEFYDEVIVYRGSRGRFATLADYETFDGALRLTNQGLHLPTGLGAFAIGADFRRNTLAPHTDTATFGDGTAAEDPVVWSGRTLDRYSFFGELQAPLLPARWLPRWIRGIETDFGARYVAADTSAEENLAPTGGLKIDFARGLALRGSVATANRFPTPYMGKRVLDAPDDPTPGPGPVEYVTITDPRRQETYAVAVREAPNPALRAESAVTRTFGAVGEVGTVHRLRASLDWVTTEKTNEQVSLDAQTAADLESFWPARVTREALPPGDTHDVGRITAITSGVVNFAWRRSENWHLTLDYTWSRCYGGTFELFGRWIGYQRYERRVLPNTPIVDELDTPDGTAAGLLRDRAAFGANWSNRTFGFGLDGRYFGPRLLPLAERTAQGHDRVSAFWQFDTYLQCELARLFPKLVGERRGLRAQVRVDNVFNSGFPLYASDPSGAGVQSYGDWRGRTYSLSLTATF
ncbi:MAG TPA: TonB-dependent receptor plug domain-containing protein [Opitutaceae bacterium]|nr:TonB-dependent receptor plug domain-containing protein [Opitutaceae bacterium]